MVLSGFYERVFALYGDMDTNFLFYHGGVLYWDRQKG